MQDLIHRLPANAMAIEKQALQLVIDSFDTYPYESGKLTLNYSPDGGGLSELHLSGPRGSRRFQVVLHPFEFSLDKFPTAKKDASE